MAAKKKSTAKKQSNPPVPACNIDLDGKVAVVIGGTSGLGRGIAEGLAQAGATVVASSRRKSKVQETAARIKELGQKTLARTVNAVSEKSVEALFTAVHDKFGQVDILVNSAGVLGKGPALKTDLDTWNMVINTNLTSVFIACKAAAPYMIKAGGGSMINIASMASFLGLNQVAAYCASKGGVRLLTQALAREWAEHNIRVNAIAPGFIITDLNRKALADPVRRKRVLDKTPMDRFGTPEEIAGTACYLASNVATFVTGQTVAVDGGFVSTGL